MTLWSDYKPLPADNNAAPPVGAPEGMWPSATNDCLREIMSVINQLGQQVTSTFAGLGNMSTQNAASVAITGGTISGVTYSGNGAGLTSLNASQLASGTVPAAALAGGTYDCTVTTAQNANAVGGLTSAMMLPVGSVIAWWGNVSALPGNWHECDGTNGTPDLRDKYIRGVGPNTGFGSAFGSYTGSTDSQGVHAHGGATGSHTLTIAEMPPHQHGVQMGWSYMNNPGGSNAPAGAGNSTLVNWAFTDYRGSGNAFSMPISSDGAHVHNVALNPPPSVGLHWIMRIW